MGNPRTIKTLHCTLIALLVSVALVGSAAVAVQAQEPPPFSGSSQIEVISPYYSELRLTSADGTQITGSIINGPSHPLPEYEAERQASMTTISPQGTLANFPSYNWVFGCSAVSGGMIAGYYDRNGYPDMYTGPTAGGVMPLTDSSWPTWVDGSVTEYPNNPLIASHNGVDGRGIKGSIDDYWIEYGSSAQDPYITGSWTQHAWGDAIGDYMKTSQSAFGNTDGSTTFWNYSTSPDKYTCANLVANGHAEDGTVGRKLFYEARGYTVTDCYNQKTDNNSGGFTLTNFKAEIDAGHPVLLNLAGHSIVGYGYNGSTIYIRDTWDNDPAAVYTMPWGGSYDGMTLLSVSVVKLGQGQAPASKQFLPMILNGNAAPPPPVNPFQNPGFEAGGLGWYQYSSGGYKLIYPISETEVGAHSGSWLAWLGGDNYEKSQLSQTITISVSAPYLHFWYWAAGIEDTCGYDFFRVGVNNNDFYTLNLCDATDTNGWVKKVLNLSGYVGTNKTVQFSVTTDGTNHSNLFLDDISMSATSTMSEVEPLSVEVYPGAALMGK